MNQPRRPAGALIVGERCGRENGCPYLVSVSRTLESVELRCATATRLLLLGGEPSAQPPLLWLNFVGREPAEMAEWAADWAGEDGGRFGVVRGNEGPRIPVPPVPRLTRG